LPAIIADTVQKFSETCNKKCDGYPKGSYQQKVCFSRCRIQTQQRIISALRTSAGRAVGVSDKQKFLKDIKRAQVRLQQYQQQLIKIQNRKPKPEPIQIAEPRSY